MKSFGIHVKMIYSILHVRFLDDGGCVDAVAAHD